MYCRAAPGQKQPSNRSESVGGETRSIEDEDDDEYEDDYGSHLYRAS
jgi:hypothetical protein